MPGPWRVVLTDSESLTGVASCEHHGGHPQDACDACYVVETYSEQAAAYMATVGPLAGLALADLLDSLGAMPASSNQVDLHYAGKLARLILGEPLPVPDGFRSVETVHLPVLGGESTW
jgi:hypothetical protein